jgi:hypothetical protein
MPVPAACQPIADEVEELSGTLADLKAELKAAPSGQKPGIKIQIDKTQHALDGKKKELAACVAVNTGPTPGPAPGPAPGPTPGPTPVPWSPRPSTLRPGATLQQGQGLTAPTEPFTLIMQDDGNLVVYRSDISQPLWASNTDGNPGSTVTMQTDGNLVLYSSNGVLIWSTSTHGHPGAHAVLQDDGNFVIYTVDGEALWASDSTWYSALPSGPVILSWAAGRIDVFQQSPDLSQLHQWYDGQWHDWESLGGSSGGQPPRPGAKAGWTFSTAVRTTLCGTSGTTTPPAASGASGNLSAAPWPDRQPPSPPARATSTSSPKGQTTRFNTSASTAPGAPGSPSAVP